jgi:hypothetical protein
MMKQVNMYLRDEDYELLVREVGKRMADTGKLVKVATLAHELLRPALDNLRNGNSPASQDNKQEAPAPKSKLAMDFASIDI